MKVLVELRLFKRTLIALCFNRKKKYISMLINLNPVNLRCIVSGCERHFTGIEFLVEGRLPGFSSESSLKKLFI